jgi:hypothetical protein
MTKFVAISEPFAGAGNSINKKYIKQTYDAMSNTGINLEYVAIQIAQLPIREQAKFLRLLLNYLDYMSNDKYKPAGAYDIVELSRRLMEVVNNYYFEQDDKQMVLDGMK